MNWFSKPSKSKGFKFKPVTIWTSKNVRNIPKKKLTYPQAIVRYPRLNPFGDADRDGKLNMFDCKPFDKKKHGKYSQNIPIEKAKYVTGYHGTSQYSAKKIKEEGMKKSYAVRPYVYITPIKSHARAFAPVVDNPTADIHKPAILKVTLPAKRVKESIAETMPKELAMRRNLKLMATEEEWPIRDNIEKKYVKELEDKELERFTRKTDIEVTPMHKPNEPNESLLEWQFSELEDKSEPTAQDLIDEAEGGK